MFWLFLGKTASIVDILDLNRVILDGPTTGVCRHKCPIRWLQLTDVVTPLPLAASKKLLVKALKANKSLRKWKNSDWAKKLAIRKRRSNLTDFDRFKLFCVKKV